MNKLPDWMNPAELDAFLVGKFGEVIAGWIESGLIAIAIVALIMGTIIAPYLRAKHGKD